jgi:hypothetical protein
MSFGNTPEKPDREEANPTAAYKEFPSPSG